MAKQVAATGPVDGPWALPDGWEWRRLGDLGEFLNGAAFKPSDWGDEGTPIIRIQNLNNPSRPMNRTTRTVSERLMVREGDLLVSWSATLDAFLWRREDAWLNQHIFKVVPNEALVDRRYMFFLLKNEIENLKKTEHLHGSTMMHINRGPFLAHLVPVPPIQTQIRVADRIDELFAEVDDGEAALARARDDLATWRKALLRAAVTGELTADWRADNSPTETGADLLAELVVDRRACWGADPRNAGKRYADAAEPMLGEVPDLPANWTWVGIEELTTGGIRNGLSLKEAAGPTAVKGLKLDALQSNGIDWSRTRHLPIDLSRAAPYLLRAGDLLISRANGSPEFVGRCTMVDEGRDDTVFPDTAIRYPIVAEPRLRAWARLAWRAPQSRKRMLALAKSTSGILKISQGDIAAVALPLPPLDEIGEIVARVGRLTAEAEAGADDLASMKSLPATLRQSILAAAFRGDLA